MAKQDSPMQAFWRLTIMLGTLTVGGMAAYVYGPPPDRLISLADELYTRAREAMQPPVAVPEAERAGPTLSSVTLATRGALSPPAAAAPPVAQPAAAWPAVASQPATGPRPAGGEVDLLQDELRRLGAGDFQLRPWGDGRLHRFCCTASLAGNSGIRRHFQAIDATPGQAIAATLAEVRRWRGESSF